MAVYTSTDTPFRAPYALAGISTAGQHVALNTFANPVPTLQHTAMGISPVGAANVSRATHAHVPSRADADAPRAMRTHPRQAPSTVLTENMISSRAGFLPGFQHNVAAVRMALTSSMQADMPRYSGQVDLLA